jgi:hypothetical protein
MSSTLSSSSVNIVSRLSTARNNASLGSYQLAIQDYEAVLSYIDEKFLRSSEFLASKDRDLIEQMTASKVKTVDRLHFVFLFYRRRFLKSCR